MTKQNSEIAIEEVEPAQVVRYHYDVAGRWFLAAFLLHLSSTGLAAAGVLLACYPTAITWLSPIAGLAVLSSYLAFWEHDHSKIKAELLQRRLLLADGLGGEWAFSERERQSMYASLSKRARRAAAKLKTAKEYYDSKAELGVQRLLDNTQESVYFTQHIAYHAGNLYRLWVVLLVTITLASIYISACALTGSAFNSLVRVAMLFLFFVLTGGVLKRCVGFDSLSKACADIDEAMDKLRKNAAITVEKVLPWVHLYNCALLVAPPLPSRIYDREHDMLTAQWLQRMSKQKFE